MRPLAGRPACDAAPMASTTRMSRPLRWVFGDSSRTIRRDVGLLVAGLVIVRLFTTFVLGSAFDAFPARIGWDMHLADLEAVKADPVGSLMHLHSQPPLYTVICTLASTLPSWATTATLFVLSLALGVGCVTATYLCARELGVRRWLSLTVVILGVVLSPSWLLWANVTFYAYWTACLISISVLCVLRFARTKKVSWGVATAVVLATLALLDSLYQPIWMVAVLVMLGLVTRIGWRRVLVVSAVPLLIVVGWSAKNLVADGTPSTSTWMGLNLSRTSIVGLSSPDLKGLIADGTLSPLAALAGFQPLAAYPPGLTSAPHTGYAVLDEVTKSNGQPNLNNLDYVKISNLMLHQDLRAVQARPGHYASNVGKALGIWSSPADRNVLIRRSTVTGTSPDARAYAAWLGTHRVLSGSMLRWSAIYGATVGLDPKASWLSITIGDKERTRYVSISAVVISALALFGVPVLIWRRRRERAQAVTWLFVWGTSAMVVGLSTFGEIGENDRFRFMLGTLPLLGAIGVIEAALRWRTRRRSNNEGTMRPTR